MKEISDAGAVGNKDNRCVKFNMLALYEEQGLERGTDGILGLSPNRDPENK